MKKILRFIFLLFTWTSVFSQAGSLDPTWGSDGRVSVDLNKNCKLRGLVRQPNNKILALVSIGYLDSGFALIRYLPNGIKDHSFGVAGIVLINFQSRGSGNAICLQPDGKILVTGTYNNIIGQAYQTSIFIDRFNEDGSLDSGFGTNGNVTTNIKLINYANSIAIQKDGKIVLAGGTSIAPYYDEIITLRYKGDGNIDSGFAGKGYVISNLDSEQQSSDMGYFVSLQEDGKIIVGGSTYEFVHYKGHAALIRFMPDGSLDPDFANEGIAITSQAKSFLGSIFQDDGKIVTVGYSSSFGGGPEAELCRFTTDGIIDSSYGLNGVAIIFNTSGNRLGVAFSIAQQADGKVVSAGEGEGPFPYNREFSGIIRFNKQGKKDKTFGENGTVLLPRPNGEFITENQYPIVIQQDGKILTGTTKTHKLYIFRLMGDQNTQFTNKVSPVIIAENVIRIYPNPVIDKLYLKGLKNSTTSIKIMDMQGDVLFNKTLNNYENSIDLHNLKSGQYIISITQNNETISTSFWKN